MAGNPEAISSFVTKIFQTPTIRSLPPMQKDEQVRLFIETNATTLRAMFAAKDQLPGVPWDEIERELFQRVGRIVDDSIKEAYQAAFASIPFVPGPGKDDIVPLDERKRAQLTEIACKALERDDARNLFQGDFNAIAFDTWSRYVDSSFSDRGYVFFELTRFDQCRLEADRMKMMLKLALALRPALFVEHLLDGSGGTPSLQRPNPAFVGRMKQHLADVLPYMPENVARACAESSLPVDSADKHVAASARFVAIASGRARFLRPGAKVERGADAPDKSWFAAARKNAAFLGYDGQMLDEFYRLASDQGW